MKPSIRLALRSDELTHADPCIIKLPVYLIFDSPGAPRRSPAWTAPPSSWWTYRGVCVRPLELNSTSWREARHCHVAPVLVYTRTHRVTYSCQGVNLAARGSPLLRGALAARFEMVIHGIEDRFRRADTFRRAFYRGHESADYTLRPAAWLELGSGLGLWWAWV